ncbi:hypothetical protein HZS_368 [Henneguya salminicola]|nr:hypothetical protein HZS_368 [Henneguya salminicola]
MQRNIQRIRQRINLPLSLPPDAAHLIIPEQYKISLRNENFLLYGGVENDGERFILFATSRQLTILSRGSNIYFDSTFKSVPEIFYQMFVIQGEYNNVLIPCVFALMERKTEIMYRRVCEKVRENVEIPCQIAIRHHRAGRSQPLFLIRLWNQSERTENGISRTNNKVEVRHNALARLVGRNPPNI